MNNAYNVVLRLAGLATGIGNIGGSFTLNESADKLMAVVQVPSGLSSYVITQVALRQASRTGTSPTYRISLQGLDGSGNNDGTIKSSGNAFVDYAPVVGNDGKIVWLTLGASY